MRLFSVLSCLFWSIYRVWRDASGRREGHLKAPVDARLLWRNLIPSSPRLSVWSANPPFSSKHIAIHTHAKHRKQADTPNAVWRKDEWWYRREIASWMTLTMCDNESLLLKGYIDKKFWLDRRGPALQTQKSVTEWLTEWWSYTIGRPSVGVSSLVVALSKWKGGNNPLFTFSEGRVCGSTHRSSAPLSEHCHQIWWRRVSQRFPFISYGKQEKQSPSAWWECCCSEGLYFIKQMSPSSATHPAHETWNKLWN